MECLPEHTIDFLSNDYLGLTRNFKIKSLTIQTLKEWKKFGAGGSRLISGESCFYKNLEKELSQFYNGTSALLFNSGYNANIGIFSCIAQRKDSIIFDEYIHNSIYNGIRLNFSEKLKFKHNDLQELEKKLCKAQGTKYVVVESLYSMSGTLAPLKEIVQLCKNYPETFLIVDEAHSGGIYGPKGEGRVVELGLEDEVFARIYTFGKAFGAFGAAVIGSKELKDYLVNFAPSFIYTTALPLAVLAQIQAAHRHLINSSSERETLWDNFRYFRKSTSREKLEEYIPSLEGPIQVFLLKKEEELRRLEKKLRTNGYGVKAILPPTVAEGKSRLRICLHSFNTPEQIDKLLALIEYHLDRK
ncbi:aminotransferase class I/II-fold pyridoxal phosphate-dependent enzyme [Bacteroidetes bacterium endosymbiont of Geopemphigus sp.]|uniref:aminotransferase class I/II-fold pyridoxal phosphate-dependent enzyme n=1 Tax=Bacteroidetes bacterium endosymbiont of Geopemphigus sp. TaxID=2047937 RepID=UPI0018A83482|nr:pyridoxal phosphate-dependent aminotransferase family protein [Bacteroidetes bacterium endosymbiont of Geopemphigus sp.]